MSADQGDSTGAQANGISAADAEAAMAALSKDPKFQSILQKHMNNFAAQNPYACMPKPVKDRVHCLKNIQVDILKLEAQFYREVQKLEVKYQSLYQPLLDKRAAVVTGKYEPSKEECKWTLDDDEEEEEEKENEDEQTSPKKGKSSQSADEGSSDQAQALTNGESEESISGIPDFWLTALKNCDIFAEMIFDHDEPILKHLTDIKVSYPDDTGLSFNLEFYFSENDYFTNKVLTKNYTMVCDITEDDPFSFEGATITSCSGCKIDWKKGKNVTVKTIKKKQKHKGKGQSRVVVKTVPNDSFFGFFSPPDPAALKDAEDDEDAEELSMKLETDFARAEFLRDRLLVKAVLFFTGEAVEDDDEDELSEVDDDDDDQDGDEDQDEDYNPESDLKDAKPPECKQQ